MKKILAITVVLALSMASCMKRTDYDENRPADYYDYAAIKRKGCPKCGSHDIAKIMYGLVYFDDDGNFLVPSSPFDSLIIDSAMSEKFKNGEFVTGGCTVEPENYYCNNCKHAW